MRTGVIGLSSEGICDGLPLPWSRPRGVRLLRLYERYYRRCEIGKGYQKGVECGNLGHNMAVQAASFHGCSCTYKGPTHPAVRSTPMWEADCDISNIVVAQLAVIDARNE